MERNLSGDHRARTVRGLTVGLLVSFALLLQPSAAYAVQAGPPDASGNWMYCNIGGGIIPGGSPATNKLSVVAACQYGPTTLQVYSITFYVRVTRSTGGTTTQGFGGSGTTVQQGASGSVASQNKDGKYAEAETITIANSTGIDLACVTQISFGRNLVGGGTPTEIYKFIGGAGGDCITTPSLTAAEADASYSGGSTATYPTQFWNGGNSGSGQTFDGTVDCAEEPTAPDCVEDTNPADPDGYTLEDCGAWYHIACHLRNALAKMFVPTTLASQFEDFIDAAETHWPFAPVVWVFDTTIDGWNSFTDSIDSGTPISGGASNASNLSAAENTECMTDVELPLGLTDNPRLPIIDNCADSQIASARIWVFRGSQVLIILGVLGFVWKMVGRLNGGGGGGGDD